MLADAPNSRGMEILVQDGQMFRLGWSENQWSLLRWNPEMPDEAAELQVFEVEATVAHGSLLAGADGIAAFVSTGKLDDGPETTALWGLLAGDAEPRFITDNVQLGRGGAYGLVGYRVWGEVEVVDGEHVFRRASLIVVDDAGEYVDRHAILPRFKYDAMAINNDGFQLNVVFEALSPNRTCPTSSRTFTSLAAGCPRHRYSI